MHRAQDRGQVLVVFAITAASMLAVVGLLYSFGLVLAQRRALQTAADAASLSGSWQVLRELASDDRSDRNVLDAVVQYARLNGVPSDGTVADATYLTASYVDATGVALSSATPVGGGGRFPSAARGVRVTVQNQVQTVLPGFLKVWQILVQDSAASAARPTASPSSAPYVIPIAVRLSDARSAYVAQTPYDLFVHPLSGGVAPTLDFSSSGAPKFGTTATSIQYWSDGQHSGSWQLSQPANVPLADAAYYDAVATGLRDNVRRQGLTDANGAAYALVSVPVYDTATSSAVHVVGFAQLKIRAADISAASARGLFVPYPAAAWGTPVVPATDLGAVLVGIVS